MEGEGSGSSVSESNITIWQESMVALRCPLKKKMDGQIVKINFHVKQNQIKQVSNDIGYNIEHDTTKFD